MDKGRVYIIIQGGALRSACTLEPIEAILIDLDNSPNRADEADAIEAEYIAYIDALALEADAENRRMVDDLDPPLMRPDDY